MDAFQFQEHAEQLCYAIKRKNGRFNSRNSNYRKTGTLKQVLPIRLLMAKYHERDETAVSRDLAKGRNPRYSGVDRYTQRNDQLEEFQSIFLKTVQEVLPLQPIVIKRVFDRNCYSKVSQMHNIRKMYLYIYNCG